MKTATLPQPSGGHAQTMGLTREERIKRAADAAALVIRTYGPDSAISLRASDVLFLVEHYRFVPNPDFPETPC